MLPLRRTAFRLLTSSSTSYTCRPRSIMTVARSPFRVASQSTLSPFLQRRWASDDSKVPVDKVEPTEEEKVENTIQTQDASEVTNGESSAPESSSSATSQDIQSDAFDTEAEETSSSQSSNDSASIEGAQLETEELSNQFDRRQEKPAPFTKEGNESSTIYIGNLFYDVSEKDLEVEFSRFGDVVNSRVIRDLRGLSKGFGYLTFANIDDAVKAKAEMMQAVFEGRRITVQFASNTFPNSGKRRIPDGPTNPVSKTLFIGNMSYQMTDKDLNELFRGIRNVIDVRVAIDRRTGQPRGFAHADFTDAKSAVEAQQVLKDKEPYGRRLRIDYSQNVGPGRRNNSRRNEE